MDVPALREIKVVDGRGVNGSSTWAVVSTRELSQLREAAVNTTHHNHNCWQGSSIDRQTLYLVP